MHTGTRRADRLESQSTLSGKINVNLCPLSYRLLCGLGRDETHIWWIGITRMLVFATFLFIKTERNGDFTSRSVDEQTIKHGLWGLVTTQLPRCASDSKCYTTIAKMGVAGALWMSHSNELRSWLVTPWPKDPFLLYSWRTNDFNLMKHIRVHELMLAFALDYCHLNGSFC